MSKKVLIEEIQRMRSMMGLKENFIPKTLINEGPGDVWKLFKMFVEGDDAIRRSVISQLESSPSAKQAFDEMFRKYKGAIDPTSSVTKLSDLTNAAYKVQLANLAKQIAGETGDNLSKLVVKAGINFAEDFVNLNRIKFATPGSPMSTALNTLKSSDPRFSDVLTKLEKNEFGDINDADLLDMVMIADLAKESATNSGDNVMAGIFKEMSDDLNKAAKEKELVTKIKNGGEAFDPNVLNRLDTELGSDEFVSAEAKLKYSKMAEENQLLFSQKLKGVEEKVKSNDFKFGDLTNDDIAYLEVAKDKGYIKATSPVYKKLWAITLNDPTIQEIIQLKKLYDEYSASNKGNKTLETENQYFIDRGYRPPKWYEKVRARGVEYTRKYFESVTQLMTLMKKKESGPVEVSWPWAKDVLMALGSVTWPIATGVTVVGGLGTLYRYLTRNFNEWDEMTKQRIIDKLPTYFKYDIPYLIYNGKEYNIYDPNWPNNPNLMYMKVPPTPEFGKGTDIDKGAFIIPGGISIWDGKKYTKFTAFEFVFDDSGLFAGSEWFNNQHVLRVAGTGTNENNQLVSGSGKLIIKGADGKQDDVKTNAKVLEALIATFGAENVGDVKVTTVVDKGDENYEITLSNGKGGTYKYDGTKLTKQK
jgi:hypothetical protein